MFRHLTLAAAALLAGPTLALAQDATPPTGDAAAGEKAFRQCQSCHVVQSPDGEVLAGRASKTGPNLWGVAGRAVGSEEEYDYSSLLEAAGEAGVVFDEATFMAYVQDPSGHLTEVTGESGRSKMSFRVRKEEDAVNLYAYLAQFGPDAE